ncbi:hypothetical protein D5086_030539 [Populus alba]|uniref:Uncharacterized protein n=1 Tax=Populus alba TaxID=43335 RepID=A0ACC4AQ49_POPAL
MMKIWKPRSRQEPSTTSVQTRQPTASEASKQEERDVLGVEPVAIYKAQGHAGGIWTISSISYVPLSTLDIIRQCVTIQVSVGSSSWFFSAAYVLPFPRVQL